VTVYVLVAILKKRLGLDASLYTILQILSLTPFEKAPLHQILGSTALAEADAHPPNQLGPPVLT
jgi:hypothetical protein